MRGTRLESGRLLIVVVVLVALSSGVIYWREVAGAPERHFREGLEAYSLGRYPRAAASWQLAADLRHGEAPTRLGGLYLEGRGVSRNHKRAFELFEGAAHQGYAKAQLQLARLYDTGRGVAPDVEQAVLWYWAAAKNDEPEAQLELGRMYAAGRGVDADEVEAAKWYGLAAEAGLGEAELSLGILHQEGRRIDKNLELAIHWLTRAAEDADIAEAWYRLGKLTETGEGMRQDAVQAAWYYEKAVKGQHADAMYRLGRLHETGRQVERDISKAASMYLQASLQGHREAQYRLGRAFETGEGAPRSRSKAEKWYGKAVEQGHVEAMAALQDLGLDRVQLSRYQQQRLERTRKGERERRATRQAQSLQRPGMCELYRAGQPVVEMRTRVDCLNRGGTFEDSNRGKPGSFVTMDTGQDWNGQRRELARRSYEQKRQQVQRDGYDRGDDYEPPSGDWIVCNSRGSRDSSGRAHYRCSSAIPKTSATTTSWCRSQGYQSRRFFKHESSARQWRSESCR